MTLRVANETKEHRAAYEIYRDMGPGRTLSAVARTISVSTTSIQRWAKSFEWLKRAKTYDADVARKTIDIAEKQGVEVEGKARARNLKLVQMGLMKLAQALASGDVRLQLADLDRLLKLEAVLNGQASPSSNGTLSAEDAELTGKNAEELWALIDGEVEAIRRIATWDDQVSDWIAAGTARPIESIERRGTCAGCGRPIDVTHDDAADDASMPEPGT